MGRALVLKGEPGIGKSALLDLASQHFTKLAGAMASDYTVYVPDRRGRGLSGGHGDDFHVTREVEDVQTLVTATGASKIFGLSSGALGALRTALVTPALDRVALYEPPLSVTRTAARRVEEPGVLRRRAGETRGRASPRADGDPHGSRALGAGERRRPRRRRRGSARVLRPAVRVRGAEPLRPARARGEAPAPGSWCLPDGCRTGPCGPWCCSWPGPAWPADRSGRICRPT
jgi:pimeloyl-ACP methyl ester carboxylesterase